jgi:hypothetical protein
MPHYYFDIQDGHRLVDPSGLEFKNDDAAIALDCGSKFLACLFIPNRQWAPRRHSQNQSAFEHAAAPGVDKRNGTERIRGERQSDGGALHPPPSET